MISRPRRVTLLALGVLSIALFNLLRFSAALRQWAFLAEQEGVSPLYIAASGAVWAASGGALFWGLWRCQRWVLWPARLFVLAYALYAWADRLLPALRYQPLAQALPPNWLFLAVFTLALLAFALGVLFRPRF